MIWVIFIIGIVNIGIGYAVAICLEHLLAEEMPIETSSDLTFDDELIIPTSKIVEQPSAKDEEPEEERHTDEIPEEWEEILEGEHLISGSFVEASVQVLRLEVGRYRDRLIKIDGHVRDCEKKPVPEMIHTVLVELKEVNEAWLAQQAEAAGHLTERAGELGDFASVGSNLEDVLMEQAAQIETTCSNIDVLDFETDISKGCRRLIVEIRKLIDLAHTLRDRMQESLVAIVKADGQLESLDRKLQFDALTDTHNRSGLEVIFHELWRDDPSRKRQISCALVDLDHFARLLERFGAVSCDKLLTSFAGLLVDLVQKDRGFDKTIRFSGQQFFIFFADTGPRSATSAMERIRQTIEETTFELDDVAIDLTVSCGVSEVLADDSTETLYKRLDKTLKKAKKSGRNNTVLFEGGEPQLVEPPQFDVKGRIVRVAG